jgi:hypothetical protein
MFVVICLFNSFLMIWLAHSVVRLVVVFGFFGWFRLLPSQLICFVGSFCRLVGCCVCIRGLVLSLLVLICLFCRRNGNACFDSLFCLDSIPTTTTNHGLGGRDGNLLLLLVLLGS